MTTFPQTLYLYENPRKGTLSELTFNSIYLTDILKSIPYSDHGAPILNSLNYSFIIDTYSKH